MATPSAADRARSNPDISVIRKFTAAAVLVRSRTERRTRVSTASSISSPAAATATLAMYHVTCTP
jgi:hypothetical protein